MSLAARQGRKDEGALLGVDAPRSEQEEALALEAIVGDGAEEDEEQQLELDEVALQGEHPKHSSSMSSSSRSGAETTLQLASPTTVTVVASDSDAPATPPVEQYKFRSLLLLFLVVIADGIALHIIVPFISGMCEDRFGVSPDAVGAAAGLLTGSFSMAVLVSSFFIGHLSDIYGRRKFLLMGLATSIVCPLLFGWTRSFAIALFSRVLSGLTNANLVLTKTVISDVPASQLSPERRALSFAYLSGVFQLSRALASALAGVAVGHEIFGYDNEYFLPCLLAGLFNLAVMLLCMQYLPESLKAKKPTVVAPPPAPVPSAEEAEAIGRRANGVQMTAIRAPRAQNRKYERVVDVADADDEPASAVAVAVAPVDEPESTAVVIADTHSPAAAAVATASPMSPNSKAPFMRLPASPLMSSDDGADPAVAPARAATAALEAEAKGRLLLSASPPSVPITPALEQDNSDHSHAPGCIGAMQFVWKRLVLGMRVVWRDTLLCKLILLQSLHAFANGSFMLLLSLFGALALEHRGLAVSAGEVSVCYVAFGMVSLFFQLVIYKRAHKRLGLYRLYLVGTLLLGISAALLPMAGYIKHWEVGRAIADGELAAPGADDSDGGALSSDPASLSWRSYWVSWSYLTLSLVGMACGFMICLPVIGGMMSLAVQGSSFRGLTLGVSQSAMSGCRGLGAAVMGALFSWVARRTACPALVFAALACLNFTCFAIAMRFSPEEIKISTGQARSQSAAAQASA